jgi:multicomponent K+:H+ antiporter subunit G
MIMPTLVEVLIAALLLIGGFFSLVGSIGLAKLSDFLKRLHGPTKATTLGVGGILLASILQHSVLGDGLGLRELLISVFLFLTAPVSAHLMVRAAMASNPNANPPPPPRTAQATVKPPTGNPQDSARQ